MDIRHSIADLLSLHDCVIIPGFGGFIGNFTPARIDPEHHTFHPPAKTLLFNINLRQNDGLLANAVAFSLGATYTEACRLIDEFTEECRCSLNAGSTVLIPQVGQLSPGIEGIIHFEQDRTSNLLPDAYGLSAFMSPPVLQQLQAQLPELNQVQRTLQLHTRKPVIPGLLRWAAVIALPLGIAAVIGFSRYGNLPSDMASNAGLFGSVFTRFSTASLVEKKAAPAPIVKTVVIPKAEIPVEKPAQKPAQKPADIAPAEANFAVIVGAFRIRENAEKLVADLQQQGFSASIFDQSKTGLFRVTLGTCAERHEAFELLATAKSTDFGGAWILAK